MSLSVFPDWTKSRIKSATPSTRVVVLGLSGAPEVGDEVLSAVNDKKIRDIAEFRKTKIRDNKLIPEPHLGFLTALLKDKNLEFYKEDKWQTNQKN